MSQTLNPTKVYESIASLTSIHVYLWTWSVFTLYPLYLSTCFCVHAESAYPSHGSFLAAIHLQMWMMPHCVCIASSLVSIQCLECAHCIMHFGDHQHLVTLLKLFHYFKLYYYSNFFMQHTLLGPWETVNIPLLQCYL